MKKTAVILTCEHASHEIPEGFHVCFKDAEAILSSHRGFDSGARALFDIFKQAYSSHAIAANYSRLLIDLNRSPKHPHLFSEFTRDLSVEKKQEIFKQFYAPFRDQAKKWVQEALSDKDTVLHLSIHSFTPRLNNKTRTTDIGFLYHPHHKAEGELAKAWRKQLTTLTPDFSLHMNRPYQGKSDGHTQALRASFKNKGYIGIELEVNQRHLKSPDETARLGRLLLQSFQQACHHLNYDVN